MDTSRSRRRFLIGSSLAAPAAMGLAGCKQRGSDAHRAHVFFSQAEAAFIEAAVARLIPKDDLGPGALEAGVPRFIDVQLAGAYGRADRWYMHGPFEKGTDQQGYQLGLTPAQGYRSAIKAIDAYCRRSHDNAAFAQLSPDLQDQVLHRLEDGSIDLGQVPAKTFFGLLWQNTLEGFLSDPIYGGNRDFVGWKLIGFKGPRYNYRDEIGQFGKPYTAPYVGLGGRDGLNPAEQDG